MEFKEFCEKVSKNLSLELCYGATSKEYGTTMRATKENPNPKYFVNYQDLSCGHPYYVAEMFDSESKFYLGSVGFEDCEGEIKFEHFEYGVSPNGTYNEKDMPIDENGNEIDGELWQFYYGKSLKRACNSLLKGGATTNPKRKPIKVW